MVPYVVQLLGEYVVEISSLILDRLTAQSSFSWPSYREFVGANGGFMALTEQRAVSYWSCYYRHAFARAEYPALVALDKLRQSELGELAAEVCRERGSGNSTARPMKCE